MAIKKERSLQWKSETAFFSIKQPPFPIPADYTTQSQVPWAQWLLEPRLVTSRLHEFHFHNWGWEEWIFLAFAASKRSTYLTWRIFIWGAVWLVFAVSGYICESLTLMAECIDSTLTKRMSNACKFLQHQNSRFVYFMLKLNLTIKSQY